MGKNGAALRAAKDNRIIQFTKEQLRQHDQLVRESFREQVLDDALQTARARMDEELKRQEEILTKTIDEEWEERKRLFASENPVDIFFEFRYCLLTISVRVLIEKFGWKYQTAEGRTADRRLNIVKFSDAVTSEIERIAGNEMLDIRHYADEVYELYGLRFGTEEIEEVE